VDTAQEYIHNRFVDSYVTELKVKVADKCFQKCFDANNSSSKIDTSENGCQAMCCDRYRASPIRTRQSATPLENVQSRLGSSIMSGKNGETEGICGTATEGRYGERLASVITHSNAAHYLPSPPSLLPAKPRLLDSCAKV
jgi:hypothetical protein